MNTPEKKEWEERMNAEFYPLDNKSATSGDFESGKFWGRKHALEDIRPFIARELTNQRKEILQEIEGKIDNLEVTDYSTVKSQVLDIIRGM